MSTTRWPKVTKEHPCPKCGKSNRCLIAPDGTAGICWRSGSKEVWQDRPARSGNGQAQREPQKPKPPKDGRTFATAHAAIAESQRQVERDANCRATLAGVWMYHGRGAAEAMKVARFDLADGDKQYRPVH